MISAIPCCRRLFLHAADWAEALALASTGSSSAARMAMTATTTSNSTSVKPRPLCEFALSNGLFFLSYSRFPRLLRVAICSGRVIGAQQPSNKKRNSRLSFAAEHSAKRSDQYPHSEFRRLDSEPKLIFAVHVNNGVFT